MRGSFAAMLLLAACADESANETDSGIGSAEGGSGGATEGEADSGESDGRGSNSDGAPSTGSAGDDGASGADASDSGAGTDEGGSAEAGDTSGASGSASGADSGAESASGVSGTDDGGTGEGGSATASAGTASDGGTDDAGDSGATDSSADEGGADEGSDGGAESGADSGAGDDGPHCGAETYNYSFEAVNPNVVLLLDKSTSMLDLWDHDDDDDTDTVTRWSSLHTVVSGLLASFDDSMNFGAQLFPSAAASLTYPDDVADACLMSVGPENPVAAANGSAILASIPAAGDDSFGGGTPAGDAVVNAASHLAGLSADVPRTMVLVTDGAPNCVDGQTGVASIDVYDEGVSAAIAAALADHAITTYVIGIGIVDETIPVPAVNPHEALTAMAEAGGVPRPGGGDPYYRVGNEVELESALSAIAGQISCTFALDVSPTYPDEVVVTIDGTELIRREDCSGGDGWAFTEPGGPFDAIQLCGASCDDLQAVGAVEVVFECP